MKEKKAKKVVYKKSHTNDEQAVTSTDNQEVKMTSSNVLKEEIEWNLKCAALEEYCRVHNKFPPQKGTVVNVVGLGSVEIGVWCHSQQKRYKHSKGRTPLNEVLFYLLHNEYQHLRSLFISSFDH